MEFTSFKRWYDYGFSGAIEQAAKMSRAEAVRFLADEVAAFVRCDPNYKREGRPNDEQFILHFGLYLVGRLDERKEASEWEAPPPANWGELPEWE